MTSNFLKLLSSQPILAKPFLIFKENQKSLYEEKERFELLKESDRIS